MSIFLRRVIAHFYVTITNRYLKLEVLHSAEMKNSLDTHILKFTLYFRSFNAFFLSNLLFQIT